MRVYIAAPFPLRRVAIDVMDMLEAHGVEVTSSWLKAPDQMTDAFARIDLDDVARADLLLALNPADWTEKGTGGRHVEFGYALALGKLIVMAGTPSNIFHFLSRVVVIDHTFPTIRDTVLALDLALHAASTLTPALAVARVVAEFERARASHAPMHSPHEAYAVLLEEVDELWTEVKGNRGRHAAALTEAVQVAAMGLRYVVDLS